MLLHYNPQSCEQWLGTSASSMNTICFTLRKKADFSAFLSEDLVKRFPNIPACCELVLEGGFVCTEKASSSRREKVLVLSCDHEEAGTPISLHGLETTKRGYDHIMVFCIGTDVLLLFFTLLWWD